MLHAGIGHEVRVGVLDGPRGVARVESITEAAIALRCTFESDVPPRPHVDLLLAVPRPKVMRRLWAQIAALGVGRIILTNAEKVERNYFDTHILMTSHSCYTRTGCGTELHCARVLSAVKPPPTKTW